MSYDRTDLLFVTEDMFAVVEHQSEQARLDVEGYDPDHLLNTPTADLVQYVVSKYELDVPTLHKDHAEVDQREGRVPVIDYFSRDYRGGRGYREVMGTHVELTIPFSGDSRMFRVRPTTYDTDPPRAAISNEGLVIQVAGSDLTPEGVQAALERALSSVDKYLNWQRGSAAELKQRLLKEAEQAVEARKAKLLNDRSLVASLGFKMKERQGSLEHTWHRRSAGKFKSRCHQHLKAHSNPNQSWLKPIISTFST